MHNLFDHYLHMLMFIEVLNMKGSGDHFNRKIVCIFYTFPLYVECMIYGNRIYVIPKMLGIVIHSVRMNKCKPII